MIVIDSKEASAFDTAIGNNILDTQNGVAGECAMPLHLTHLLERAIYEMPSLVSGNWLEIILGIFIFLVSQLLFFYRRGWEEMKSRLAESIGIGVLAVAIGWMALFVYSLGVSLYRDHQNTTGRWAAVVNEKNTLKQELQQRDDYIKTLERRSASNVMGQLNATGPLKMFISAQLLEKVGDSSIPERKMFVLLAITNKKVSPVDVLIRCNYDFIITEQPLVASQEQMTVYQMTTVDQVSSHEVRYKMQSPAWGPQNPMEIPVLVNNFDNGKSMKCTITSQS